MFAQERMSKNSLLANMMPIMEFEKGGGAYVPPTDYANQWKQAQTAYNKGTDAANKASELTSRPNTPEQTQQLNALVNTSVDELDSAISVASSVPDNAYTSVQTMFYSKSDAVNTLVTLKNNLKRFTSAPTASISPFVPVANTAVFTPVSLEPVYVPGLNAEPPPKPWRRKKTYFELLGEEIDRQVVAMRAINRVLGKPIEPARPEFIWPTNSWQYELWSKGYSQQEISWAENYQASKNLQNTTNGDFALFKREVENALQDAILAGTEFAPRIDQEISTTGVVEPTVMPISFADRSCLPPHMISQMPYSPPVIEQIGDQQVILGRGLAYPGAEFVVSIEDVDMPMVDMPRQMPVDPRDIPLPIRRDRRFVRTPRPIPTLPPVPGGGRICGTGAMPSIGNWEDALIGAGATVDELDTIRRMMAATKFAKNTDMISAAKRMLQNLRWQVGNTTEAVQAVQPTTFTTIAGNFVSSVSVEDSAPAPTPTPIVHSASNPTNTIPGVRRTSISRGATVRANALAKRETTQARRGAVIRRR